MIVCKKFGVENFSPVTFWVADGIYEKNGQNKCRVEAMNSFH